MSDISGSYSKHNYLIYYKKNSTFYLIMM